jgi:uncharacterized membrane protein YbhN (UPF0104 family)
VKVFASSKDDERGRRPTDAILLIGALGSLVFATFAARDGAPVGRAVTAFVNSLPGLAGWFWQLSYDLMVVWAVVLVAVALASRGRLALVRDQVVGLVLTALAAGAVGRLTGDWPDLVSAVADAGPPPVYPGVRVALAAAVISTASPHLSRPLRYAGRWILLAGAVGSVALGTARPLGAYAGFAVGIGVAALVHLVFGSPGGNPSLPQIGDSLRELGVDATDLRSMQRQSGVVVLTGTDASGHDLRVRVYGRDAWGGQLLAVVWRFLWYRNDARTLVLSRFEQVEHEALATVLAERGGVHVPDVVVAGATSQGDALLVLRAGGVPLGDLDPGSVTDAIVDEVWSQVGGLHALGIAHGELDAAHVAVAGPEVSLLDLSDAIISAPAPAIDADRAAVLMATAALIGIDRAVQAALRSLGPERLGEVVSYVQLAAATRDTQRRLRKNVDVDDLRDEAVEVAQVDAPDLEKLRRVTWGSVITAALLFMGGYFLVRSLAGVDLGEVLDELEGANYWVLALAAIVGQTPRVALAFSTLGASPFPLRLGPVVALEFAISFINLAVPSTAARLATKIRFFEKQGVPAAPAVSISALDSFAGFLVQTLLLVLVLLSGAASIDLNLDFSSLEGDEWMIAAAVGVVVLLVVLTLTVPKLRNFVVPRVREAKEPLQVLRSPSKLGMLFGGNVASQVLFAAALSLCLSAFGSHLPLAQLILINTAVSLFAGLMPVPGGIGVSEAALTAGLTASGIDPDTAFAVAISYRIITFYLPPLWGAAALAWMRRQSYL